MIGGAARHVVVRLAFIIGLIGGPLMALIEPDFDVLYAGIGGGTLAYAVERFWIRPRHLARNEGAS